MLRHRLPRHFQSPTSGRQKNPADRRQWRRATIGSIQSLPSEPCQTFAFRERRPFQVPRAGTVRRVAGSALPRRQGSEKIQRTHAALGLDRVAPTRHRFALHPFQRSGARRHPPGERAHLYRNCRKSPASFDEMGRFRAVPT